MGDLALYTDFAFTFVTLQGEYMDIFWNCILAKFRSRMGRILALSLRRTNQLGGMYLKGYLNTLLEQSRPALVN